MIAAIALVTAALTVVYPGPGAHLPFVARSFAFGAAPPGFAVSVNGVAAHCGKDGGWIAYLPFRPGHFTLHVVAIARRSNSATTLDRTIDVDEPLLTTPAAPAAFDAAFAAQPARALVVRPGELIRLSVKGSAYSRVTASIGGALVVVPLTGDFQSGSYRADVRAPAFAPAGALPVRYRLRSSDGSSASVDARGTVTVEQTSVARVGIIAPWHDDDGYQSHGIVMRSPGEDYFMFPPLGTPFAIVGGYGDFYCVALGATRRGFIYKKRLALEPAGSPVPSAELDGIDVKTDERATRIIIRLSGRVPFQLVDDAAVASLDLRLFGASERARDVRYGAGPSGVSTVTWPAAPKGTLDMRIALRQRSLWGYSAAWTGDDLVITAKRPPHLSTEPGRAVSGLLVVIDPGHAPDSGAIGPLGTLERDVNLAIAQRLAAHLQALGARILLTRSEGAGIGLYDRVDLAARAGADVLISVHNNAWPDGVDPRMHHGYSVYYYRTQSRDLARALRAAYASSSGLPDEGMYVDDLALARPTEQPSVLTESAFITWPDEEERLRSPSFQDLLGATLAQGIERWAEERRNRDREPGPIRSPHR